MGFGCKRRVFAPGEVEKRSIKDHMGGRDWNVFENIHYLCLANIDAQEHLIADSRFSTKH